MPGTSAQPGVSPAAALSLFDDFIRGQGNVQGNVDERGAASAPTWSAVGPTMAAALAAAEERWAGERRALEMEAATLRKQKAEDAQVMSQTATLVQMLQESHTALVSSNTHLLAELQVGRGAYGVCACSCRVCAIPICRNLSSAKRTHTGAQETARVRGGTVST